MGERFSVFFFGSANGFRQQVDPLSPGELPANGGAKTSFPSLSLILVYICVPLEPTPEAERHTQREREKPNFHRHITTGRKSAIRFICGVDTQCIESIVRPTQREREDRLSVRSGLVTVAITSYDYGNYTHIRGREFIMGLVVVVTGCRGCSAGYISMKN